MPTIAVIAASGRTGRVFVEQALAAGYSVRAGVRGNDVFAPHERLEVIQCDATNRADIERLISGCDIVVSLIGHGRKSPKNLQTIATQHILDAMRAQGIKRVISLTGTGARRAGDTPSYIDRLATFAITTIDPNRVKDGIEHAAVLAASDREWTIVRVLKLTNGKHRGDVRFSLTGPAELLTPRRRVAAAILQIIEDDSYVKQMPIVSGVRVDAQLQ